MGRIFFANLFSELTNSTSYFERESISDFSSLQINQNLHLTEIETENILTC